VEPVVLCFRERRQCSVACIAGVSTDLQDSPASGSRVLVGRG